MICNELLSFVQRAWEYISSSLNHAHFILALPFNTSFSFGQASTLLLRLHRNFIALRISNWSITLVVFTREHNALELPGHGPYNVLYHGLYGALAGLFACNEASITVLNSDTTFWKTHKNSKFIYVADVSRRGRCRSRGAVRSYRGLYCTRENKLPNQSFPLNGERK